MYANGFVHYALFFCDQDYELCRVFDSMVYEDETTDHLSMAIQGSGELDAQQTRQALHLSMILHI